MNFLISLLDFLIPRFTKIETAVAHEDGCYRPLCDAKYILNDDILREATDYIVMMQCFTIFGLSFFASFDENDRVLTSQWLKNQEDKGNGCN